jgi:penicillin-binding protein 1A
MAAGDKRPPAKKPASKATKATKATRASSSTRATGATKASRATGATKTGSGRASRAAIPAKPEEPMGMWARYRRRRFEKRSLLWRFRRFLFLIALLGIVALAGVGLVVSQIELPQANESLLETSFVCSSEVTPDQGCNADNAMFRLNGEENRVRVTLDEIPEQTINAIIAAEDRDFRTHNGVDAVGIARAAYANIQNESVQQGGSTITQQLVRAIYLTNERSLVRKVREAVLAVKLEQEMSKDEILERYLNTVYFGRGAYGIQAASRAYFGIDVEELTVADSAYLAGLIRSPETGDAERDPEEATRRRETVLNAMLEEQYIEQAEYDAADAQPWILNPFGRLPLPDGTVGNLVPRVEADTLGNVQGAEYGTEYFAEHVRQLLAEEYGEDVVYGGGLRVYTTLDRSMQQAAYRAVTSNLADPDDPEGSLVAIDDQGRVRAMMGGENYDLSQVNLATGADGGGSGRQPGSTFKAFALAEALEQGYAADAALPAPGSVELDIPGGGKWRVSGGAGSGGSHTLISGTQSSSNTFYAQLMLQLGTENVVDMAHRLGVQSDLPNVPSLVLGSGEVSVMDMASAYSTFPSHGVHHPATVIARVENADGEVLYEYDPVAEGQEVISPAIADTVTYALQRVVDAGTGTVAGQIPRDAAGKTGTTQNNRDAWFSGYTCNFTATVWIGYVGAPGEEPRTLGSSVFGGTIPATIWRDFMSSDEVMGRVNGECEFAEPPEFAGRQFNREDLQVPLPEATVPETSTSVSAGPPTSASSTTTTPTTAPPPTSTTTPTVTVPPLP